MSIKLVSTTPLLQVFVLAHECYCSLRGRCECSLCEDGRRIPASLTIAGGSEVGSLHPSIVLVPAIQRALRTGQLRAEQFMVQPAPSGGMVRGTATVEEPQIPQRKTTSQRTRNRGEE